MIVLRTTELRKSFLLNCGICGFFYVWGFDSFQCWWLSDSLKQVKNKRCRLQRDNAPALWCYSPVGLLNRITVTVMYREDENVPALWCYSQWASWIAELWQSCTEKMKMYRPATPPANHTYTVYDLPSTRLPQASGLLLSGTVTSTSGSSDSWPRSEAAGLTLIWYPTQ